MCVCVYNLTSMYVSACVSIVVLMYIINGINDTVTLRMRRVILR